MPRTHRETFLVQGGELEDLPLPVVVAFPKKELNDLVCRLSGYNLANPSPTFQVRPAEGSVLGVGEEVEGLPGLVSISLNFAATLRLSDRSPTEFARSGWPENRPAGHAYVPHLHRGPGKCSRSCRR
jgi:hypothetical protein